jgi:hypothetical protein
MMKLFYLYFCYTGFELSREMLECVEFMKAKNMQQVFASVSIAVSPTLLILLQISTQLVQS